MIKVIAEDFIKHEFLTEVAPLYKELVAKTKEEERNIEYNLFVDKEEQGHFIFIEEWPDMEALDVHCRSEHFRRLVPAIDKFQSKKGTVIIMDPFTS